MEKNCNSIRKLVSIYKKSNYVVFLWIIFSFILTMKLNYRQCIEGNDLHGVFDILFYMSLFVILLITVVSYLLLFMNNKDLANSDSPNLGCYGDVMELGDHELVTKPIDFNTLPLFILIIFSSSKIIVILYKSTIIEEVIPLLILLVVFLVSLIPWCKKEKKHYSISVLIFGILYIVINIWWMELVPYLKDIINTLSCIVNHIKTN